MSETVAALETEFPNQTIEVWSQDEARLGLKPVLRRVWTKRNERRRAVVEPRYEWLWLYAAVHPRSGRVFWLILPLLNGDCVQLFLDEFAQTHLEENKIIVLLWDGAPAHRTHKLRIPARMRLINYPPYTPELNPSERLWSPVKEVIVNERQASIDELEEKIVARCRTISQAPESVKSLTSYHWWSYS